MFSKAGDRPMVPSELLDEQSEVTLSTRDFDTFANAINIAFIPNEPLQKALRAARKIKQT